MYKQKSFGIVLTIIFIVLIVVFLSLNKKIENKPTVVGDSSILSGEQATLGSWTSGTDGLKERLNAIGLPALSAEGSALHIHQHIDIFIHGKSIIVPAGIGIGFLDAFISPLHTHSADQVIHVESPTIQDFTLGQFFDVWGVKFSAQSIGGYDSDVENKIQVFVNGKEQTGDPRAIILLSHQEIVVTFGTKNELPKVIPSTYKFSIGE